MLRAVFVLLLTVQQVFATEAVGKQTQKSFEVHHHDSVADNPYFQDVSYRSTFKGVDAIADWESLPFSGVDKNQVVYAEAPQCFFALSEGVLYSSAHNAEQTKTALSSPFGKWQSFHTIGESATFLVSSKTAGAAFFVVTDDNLAAVTLSEPSSSAPCGAVETVSYLLASPQAWGTVTAVTSSSSAVWLAGSNFGLAQVNVNSLETKSCAVNTIDVASSGIGSVLWVEPWSKLFVGTSLAFYTYTFVDGTVSKVSHEWVGAIIDTLPLDMAYDAEHDNVYIAESESIHRLSADGRLWRMGARQGSTNANISSVTVSGGFVWVGSAYGVSRTATFSEQGHPGKDTWKEDPWKWSYYHGQRYLPDNSVKFVVSTGDSVKDAGVVFVGGATGLALLESSLWTLKQKDAIMGSFQLPRHSRYGLVTDAELSVYGDLNSYWNDCSDNDGLWTSMHVMGEVYRYLVTGDDQAREWAWDGFEALETLAILPGDYPHFPARSFCKTTDTTGGCTGDVWKNSTVRDGYMWKSTTSSDELDGHLAAFPLVYDHIAKTKEEKDRVYTLIEGITGGILENDLYLIDPSTGEPTIWGFWNPSVVNDDPEHYSERGTNSLGILAYCASAYSITHDEKYFETFWDLANNHGYIDNCNNAKIDCPLEDNHSDNELLFQTYHILFYALQRLDAKDPSLSSVRANVEAMIAPLIPGLDRMWTIVKPERSPLWLGFYAGTAGRPVCPVAQSESVWTLRRAVMDLIDWPVNNDDRWDVVSSPYYPRDPHEGDPPEMRQILPPAERAVRKWNSDPYTQGTQGGGMNEEAPYIWRLPYYLLVYNGLLE